MTAPSGTSHVYGCEALDCREIATVESEIWRNGDWHWVAQCGVHAGTMRGQRAIRD